MLNKVNHIGCVDISSVIIAHYDAYIETPIKVKSPRDMMPNYYERETARYNELYKTLRELGDEFISIANTMDEVHGNIVWCNTEHFYSAGFIQGMKYAAHVINLSNQLNSQTLESMSLAEAACTVGLLIE